MVEILDMMRRIRQTAAMLACLGVGVGAYSVGAVRALAAPPDDAYQLVWHDEFKGNKLNLNKWFYRGLGPRKGGVNVKGNVHVGDGQLTIITNKVGEKFHTGMIGTGETMLYRYGYVETRVRFPREVGHWAAFWLQSPTINKPPYDDPAGQGAEIDIIEYLRLTPDLVRSNIHWGGYGKHHQQAHHQAMVTGLGDGFHIIGLAWTPTQYTFYVDGQAIWQTNQAVSQRTQGIILSDEIGKWAGDINDAKLPDSVSFDYVRLYQLPSQKGNLLNDPGQTPTPEPGSLTLLGLGALAMLKRRRGA